jgi:hypothetical protein
VCGFIRLINQKGVGVSIPTDILDALNRDVIDYLEGVSDPEKAHTSKRLDRDKGHETHARVGSGDESKPQTQTISLSLKTGRS